MIVTEDVDLLDDLLRLCAAAGAEPEVHHTLPDRRGAGIGLPWFLSGTTRHSGAVGRLVGGV